MRRPRRAALVLALLLTSWALTGCGGGDQEDASAEDRLAAAKTALDETPGVRLTLATPNLPRGVDGLVEATGFGTHAPAFEGDLKVATLGVTADAAVVAVDGVVYAKLPFTTSFVEVDPADYGAPDPAALMATDGGLSSLLTAAQDVETGEQVRDRDRVLSTFSGTLPGDVVAGVIPSASASADFDATFTLDGSDRLDRVTMIGPFYPGSDDVRYTIDFERYGVQKDITAP